MQFVPLALPGLVLIQPVIHRDDRGYLVKSYRSDLFLKHGIHFTPREEFYSVSRAGVLRGMHFQSPPSDYGKLVHCVHGRFHEVILDLRAGSPTYGQVWSGQLDDVKCEAVYLPPGFAHGFFSLAPETIVAYSVSHIHDPSLDQGVHWDSFGHVWPSTTPVVSPRDCAFPAFSKFATPFRFP
jgi:dTDP-4-dehydrorhamnose 3,5-epimerase